MRDILFRGKRFDTKDWIYGSLLENDVIVTKGATDVDEEYIGFSGDWSSVLPETVGQYTGLTDKHGTKIFDGDIIRNTANRHWNLQVVKYGDCRNWIIDSVGNKPFKASQCSCLVSDLAQSIFEVIGNIYDNEVQK